MAPLRLRCASGSSSSPSGVQKCRKALSRPKSSLRPASPGSQRPPPVEHSPTGQACLSVRAECCGRTCSKHLLHRHSVPSNSSTCFAAASCHSAPPQGFRASSLARELSPALRPHLRQAQVHGTRPFLEGTVPGSGHGPTGRRSCRPSAGAWLRKTISIASWRLGSSHSLACPSRPHGGKTDSPTPAATPRLPPARRSSAA